MSETPPPYANYPRTMSAYGSAARLQSLSDGYFGLSKVFVINIVLALIIRLATTFSAPSTVSGVLGLVGAIVVGTTILIGFLTYGPNKKIGEGAGWSPAQPVIASILMGLNSALCCGIIGYVVMQTIASNHIKKYGIKTGFFGLKKKDVAQKISELQDRKSVV